MNNLSSIPFHIEPMTRQEFLGREKRLTISYSIIKVSLGSFLVASTTKGVCFLMPAEKRWAPVDELKKRFPHARFRKQKVKHHVRTAMLLRGRYEKVSDFHFHLHGTNFQIAVWEDLLQIPSGMVTTYLDIAKRVGRPKAARPVGQAVGKNPIVYLIPCHRVICKDGTLGGYHWGVTKKIKYLNMETKAVARIKGMSSWAPTFF